jgi:hypothetical protein
MARSPASLGQELSQLREALENAYYRQRTVEQRLRAVLQEVGRTARRIEIFDVVGANSGQPAVPPTIPAAPDPAIWPRERRAGRILRPTPGLANLTMRDATIPVIGISVCGFEPAQLEQIVAMIAEKQLADQDFIPVFLTDSLHAEIFRAHRYAFEYLSMTQPKRRLKGTTSWEDYAAARLAMIKRKYGLTRILTFGKLPFGMS